MIINGAGKTTFFNCLNEDVKMTGGSFFLEDEAGRRRKVAAEDIGYVLSTPGGRKAGGRKRKRQKNHPLIRRNHPLVWRKHEKI